MKEGKIYLHIECKECLNQQQAAHLAALAEKDEQLDSLLAESIILARQKDELKEQIAMLKEALKWVLPMAKAYAAEHPVGRNQIIVNEAQAALKDE